MGCGECCRGRFDILITPADHARIVEQRWQETPEFHGILLATPHGEGFRLAHREDGACIFLDDQGKCRIHARFGEPAKPLACRLYPFRFVPLGGQVRVDVRYDCPATASNRGASISRQRTALLQLLPDAMPSAALDAPPPPLYGHMRASWAQLCRITEAFERLVHDERLDLTRRLVGCANLAAALQSPRIAELEGRKLSELLEAAGAKIHEALAADPLTRQDPGGMVRAMFRQLLLTYGREDRRGQQSSMLKRLGESWRMGRGRGEVPSFRQDLAHVHFEEVELAIDTPPTDVTDVYSRYLRMRLAGMGFFGPYFYHRPYLDGLNGLLLTYPLFLWYVQAFAIGQQLPTPTRACAEHALQVVDHQHGITPVLDFPTERLRFRQLTDRSTLRELILWYGS